MSSDANDLAIREAMLAVIRDTLLAFQPVPRANARSAASMEIALETKLGVAVTVSMPRYGGALIRVHGADGTRLFEWVEDDVSALD